MSHVPIIISLETKELSNVMACCMVDNNLQCRIKAIELILSKLKNAKHTYIKEVITIGPPSDSADALLYCEKKEKKVAERTNATMLRADDYDEKRKAAFANKKRK